MGTSSGMSSVLYDLAVAYYFPPYRDSTYSLTHEGEGREKRGEAGWVGETKRWREKRGGRRRVLFPISITRGARAQGSARRARGRTDGAGESMKKNLRRGGGEGSEGGQVSFCHSD